MGCCLLDEGKIFRGLFLAFAALLCSSSKKEMLKLKKLTARSIALMGLLIALSVVITRLISVETTFLRISFGFIPQVIMGIIFGPFWSGIGGVIADLIGSNFFGRAPFFIGFTLSAFIEGSLYGCFFYKKTITLKRAFMAVLAVTLISNLFLTPLWLALMYNVPFFSWIIWLPRLIRTALWFPLQVAMTYIVASSLPYKRLLGAANLFK